MQEKTKSNDWLKVSAGLNHTLALKNSGALWSFGLNAMGQLGNGTTSSTTSLSQEFTKMTDWKEIGAGVGTSFAIKTDGTLYSWGENRLIIENNETFSYSDQSKPIEIPGLSKAWKSLNINNSNINILQNDNGDIYRVDSPTTDNQFVYPTQILKRGF